jgi:hypothetical protein
METPTEPPPTLTTRARTAIGLVVTYVVVSLILTWPLALHLSDTLVGLAQVDLFDTAWLRLATARSLWAGTWPHTTELFAPAGYPLAGLLPNALDHVLAAPFVLLLPWPLADNLYWLALLTANGLAAHALGRQEGGSHRAGFLIGVLFATSDAVLREANLGRSPEAMLFATPLYLAAILRTLRPTGRWRDAIAAGGWLAVAGLGYWYQALFLVVVSVPLGAAALTTPDRLAAVRRCAAAAATAVCVVVIPLALVLSRQDDLPDPSQAAAPPTLDLTQRIAEIPTSDRWQFGQGSDPAWPLRPTPLDRSNRISVVLLGTAFLGLCRRQSLPGWAIAAMWLVPASMILGPYAKLGEAPLTLGGHPVWLPAGWIAEIFPIFERLSWPQRWGATAILPLLLLAAQAPAPRRWAAIAILEALLLSGNAPLALTDVTPVLGWRRLATDGGAVLVVPLDRQGPKGPTIGLIYRAVGGAIAAPVDIPPGAAKPQAWEEWQRTCTFCAWVDQLPDAHPPRRDAPNPKVAAFDPASLDALRADHITAIAVDATPGGMVSSARSRRLRHTLDAAIGPSEDVGSAYVWWLDERASTGTATARDAWRKTVLSHPPLSGHAPDSRTIVRPVRWEP